MRLAKVTLVVRDYDEAIAHYVGDLGFAVLEDKPMGGGKRWVVVTPGEGSTAFVLARAANETQAASVGNQTGGRVGFFLETDDFERDYARLHARGVNFLETPRVEAYGKVVVFADRFGNKWDLIGRTP